jgi:hypothetical protein
MVFEKEAVIIDSCPVFDLIQRKKVLRLLLAELGENEGFYFVSFQKDVHSKIFSREALEMSDHGLTEFLESTGLYSRNSIVSFTEGFVFCIDLDTGKIGMEKISSRVPGTAAVKNKEFSETVFSEWKNKTYLIIGHRLHLLDLYDFDRGHEIFDKYNPVLQRSWVLAYITEGPPKRRPSTAYFENDK